MTSHMTHLRKCLPVWVSMAIVLGDVGRVSAQSVKDRIDQLITHQESGLLAPLYDKEQLQKDWETLLNDSEYAATLAHNAKAFVEANFSAKRMADEYMVLFEELVKEKVDA